MHGISKVLERMTRLPWVTGCVMMLLVPASTLKAEDLSDMREWTGSEGGSLQARFIEADPDEETVRLRRNDGRYFTFSWDKLHPDDKKLVKEHLAAEKRRNAARRIPDKNPKKKEEDKKGLPRSFELKGVPMVRQKHNYCVPASATMIAGYHDHDTDQEEVAKLSSESSASSQGTFPGDMLHAMRKLGFEGSLHHWLDSKTFEESMLPLIRRSLVQSGPLYISFKPGVFGSGGHGCVLIGYDDRREELHFHNPWGNTFKKTYDEVAQQGHGLARIQPLEEAPSASMEFIERVKEVIPEFEGVFPRLKSRLEQAGISAELVWGSRKDARDDKRFAENTARRDGRKILKLAFRRSPAVLIPYSPEGETKACFLVTRPPDGGAQFLVREIDDSGWSKAELRTLGSLTRNWPTSLKTTDGSTIWDLPMIELKAAD